MCSGAHCSGTIQFQLSHTITHSRLFFFQTMLFFSIYCSFCVCAWPMCSFDGWLAVLLTCFSESFIVSRQQYCLMITDTCSMQTFAQHNSLKKQLVTNTTATSTTTCVQVHAFSLLLLFFVIPLFALSNHQQQQHGWLLRLSLVCFRR